LAQVGGSLSETFSAGQHCCISALYGTPPGRHAAWFQEAEDAELADVVGDLSAIA
jgi:hypothetical protein